MIIKNKKGKSITENFPDEWTDWDEDEELGCVDLEDRLDAALDRAFPK